MAEKSDAAKREEEILAFWKENKIFEKSLQKGDKEYVFYDGPPFATGTPHYGHIVASVIKDAVPRYWTMRGYRSPRRWGWDCHGLPIENIVEKELGFKHKKDILNYGIAKFNEMCRSKVLMYVDEWKKVIPRIGRWADMDAPYFTMSRDFMESVWWAFKQLYDKGLVYEDYRSMHICPRCETTLSQSEVAEGYKEVKDLAVTVKFELVDEPGTFFLAWTTTPWTLPGNVALAVGPHVKYSLVQAANGRYIVASESIGRVFTTETVKVEKEFSGKDLVGKKYKPPFDYYTSDATLKNRGNGWKVYAADFVTAEEGTGIAHEAPAFGADDWELSKKYNLPFIQHVNFDGTFKTEVKAFAGEDLSPRAKNKPEEVREIDLKIGKFLDKKGLLFDSKKYEHSYPHCWRCETPLLNYATSSWFVKIEAQKEALLKNAEPINWSPAHIKEGRWGKWLEGARDWSISRQRFWASVIPIWRCEKCKTVRVFGSAAELEEASGRKIDDLHKHIVDEIVFSCWECDGEMQRIPDVLDTWFDSGSMPYGQTHFLGEISLPPNFPAKFIAEGQDQTRAWFYYLHVIAISIFGRNAFENVIVNGIVLAEDGKKMSKRLQNYPDPLDIVEKYGADALRLYLLSSSVVQAENLNFSEKGITEWKSVLTRLENVLSFYQLYRTDVAHEPQRASEHVLDRWIIARLHEVHTQITEAMNAYDLAKATRPLSGFIDDLSQWYLRRSRGRIKSTPDASSVPILSYITKYRNSNENDRQSALSTLLFVMREFAKTIAPFAPFMAEHLWQELKMQGDTESVHLAEWSEQENVDEEVIAQMRTAREIVSKALEARDSAKVKVRQPLQKLTIDSLQLAEGFLELIRDEINVKEVATGEHFALDTNMTDELREEGMLRDIVREIQVFRKDQGMKPGESGTYQIPTTHDRKFIERYRTEIEKITNIHLQF